MLAETKNPANFYRCKSMIVDTDMSNIIPNNFYKRLSAFNASSVGRIFADMCFSTPEITLFKKESLEDYVMVFCDGSVSQLLAFS